MPERGEFLTVLRERYRSYEETVEELEKNRKPFEGIFGMKGGPADNPCHDRFADEMRGLFADYAASSPASSEVREVLDFVYAEPLRYQGPQCVYWMLTAVQGMTEVLIPLLKPEDAKALAASYGKQYPRWKRLPNQDQLLARLKKAAE